MENIELKKNTTVLVFRNFHVPILPPADFFFLWYKLCVLWGVRAPVLELPRRPDLQGSWMKQFPENNVLSGLHRHHQLWFPCKSLKKTKTKTKNPSAEVNPSWVQLRTELQPHPISKPVNPGPCVLPDLLVSWAPQQNFPRTHCGKTLIYSVYIQTISKYITAHETPRYNIS